ncbi:MAG: H(+)/Cl(-) exchange transporter ClcA [Succinivibrionaceae bacterium]|nr:H(+)/Cl(-) exchange transporter ClcA [Succinivibrionaceae bacterium]
MNANQISRKQRHRFLVRRAIRRLLKREIVPGRVMILAALLGAMIGFVCVVFQLLPELIAIYRLEWFAGSEGSPGDYFLLFVSSGLLAAFALFLTFRFAPEAGGSGIPEIEGALDRKRPVRWWRVLPVKLVGGMASLSSGMILGREGPSIQIGGNLGKMGADLALLPKRHSMALLAAGGAAGLAAAFNAPLAGLLFVLEELRPQFRYSFLSVNIVAVTVVTAAMIRCCILSSDPVFAGLPVFATPEPASYVWFVVLGCAAGVFGVCFNRMIGFFQDLYLRIHSGKLMRALLLIFLVGGMFGILSVAVPDAAGSGMMSIPSWIGSHVALPTLAALLAARTAGIMLCFCSGIPGGIFAPSLAIGTILGAILGTALETAGLPWAPETGILAITGMCAIFAASVRAPVTGIVLATEMTNNYQFLLPMMITTLTATIVAQKLGGMPIYTQILNRTLRLAAQRRSRG